MELAMCRVMLLLSWVLAGLAGMSACAPRPLPAGAPADLPLKPGRYVLECAAAPGFRAAEATYALSPVSVVEARGLAPETVVQLFQEELPRAWQAQGLKLGQGPEAVRLALSVHHLSVWGGRFRLVTGRLHARLTLSGTLSRGEQTLFTVRDRLSLSSPIAPGPGAPKEKELLLRLLIRETLHHLLNELLLQGDTADSG